MNSHLTSKHFVSSQFTSADSMDSLNVVFKVEQHYRRTVGHSVVILYYQVEFILKQGLMWPDYQSSG